MLKEILDELNPDETDIETLSVMTYELGDFAKCLFYKQKYNEPSYMIEAKIALSDLIAQCIYMCEKQGWDFELEVKPMGIARFIEKVKRHIEKGE